MLRAHVETIPDGKVVSKHRTWRGAVRKVTTSDKLVAVNDITGERWSLPPLGKVKNPLLGRLGEGI